jgi:hypothetical protein
MAEAACGRTLNPLRRVVLLTQTSRHTRREFVSSVVALVSCGRERGPSKSGRPSYIFSARVAA